MDKTVILAKKYGRAIYEIAVEQHTLEQTEKDLKLIASAISENEDLKKLLSHPLLSKEIKKDTIKKIFADKVQPIVLQFCYVVIDKDRASILESMIDVYTSLAMKDWVWRKLWLPVRLLLPVNRPMHSVQSWKKLPGRRLSCGRKWIQRCSVALP